MRIPKKVLDAMRQAASEHETVRVLTEADTDDGTLYPVRKGSKVSWFAQVPYERNDGARSYWDTAAIPVRAPREARALLRALRGK